MPGRHPFVQGIPPDAFPPTVRLGRDLPLAALLRFPVQLEGGQIGDAHDGEANGFEAVVCFFCGDEGGVISEGPFRWSRVE